MYQSKIVSGCEKTQRWSASLYTSVHLPPPLLSLSLCTNNNLVKGSSLYPALSNTRRTDLEGGSTSGNSQRNRATRVWSHSSTRIESRTQYTCTLWTPFPVHPERATHLTVWSSTGHKRNSSFLLCSLLLLTEGRSPQKTWILLTSQSHVTNRRVQCIYNFTNLQYTRPYTRYLNCWSP